MAYSVQRLRGGVVAQRVESSQLPQFGDELVVEGREGGSTRYRVLGVQHLIGSPDQVGDRQASTIVLVDVDDGQNSLGAALKRGWQ